MGDSVSMKKWIFTLLLGATLSTAFFAAPEAQAQTFSSKGINQGDDDTSVDRCADGAFKSQQRILTLRKRINTILNCNNLGETYDKNTHACVKPKLSPDHVYKNRAAGDTLALVNPDGTNGVAVVLGGKNGSSITCVENPVGCSLP